MGHYCEVRVKLEGQYSGVTGKLVGHYNGVLVKLVGHYSGVSVKAVSKIAMLTQTFKNKQYNNEIHDSHLLRYQIVLSGSHCFLSNVVFNFKKCS